ncbi:MAG: zinc-ribbon domain-containing protein [Candidatus Atribacteria bacterium]|nr:zinc-ribbon domain-containing protein [Candidatus Atribacteria bacterium]MBE3122552.1 zinc-ribbon domain-containing protein [Thermoplasmata archaeon]
MNEDRKCPNCGRPIPFDANLCPYCGKKFIESGIKTERTHTSFGIASLVFGVIAFCLLFIPRGFIPYSLMSLYCALNLLIGALAMIFGGFSYWIKKPKDAYGKIGFILGILTVVIGFLQFIIYSSINY